MTATVRTATLSLGNRECECAIGSSALVASLALLNFWLCNRVSRIVTRGHRRELGLGAVGLVSLAEARELARSEGEPLAESRRVQGVPTIAEVALRVVEHKHGGWRGRHHAHNWLRSLECYGFPPIGGRLTSKVSTARRLCSSADISETGNRSRGRGAPATSRPLTKAPAEYHVLGSALTPHAA